MNHTAKSLTLGFSLAGLLSSCATVAPNELVDARNAYSASSNGLASQLTPTDLHDAKTVLDQANSEFERNGDSLAVRDTAYVALRKVELADAKARTEADHRAIAEAVKQGVVVRDNQVKYSQAALAETREALRGERSTNAAQGAELQRTASQLASESEARQMTQTRLDAAMKDLHTIASVRDEARGVVITLSGSVIFASGGYTLLETAKAKLDQVAEALKDQSEEKRMTVEGHTDSMGSEASNQRLGQNRANAVRDYLVSRGVDGTKLIAVGMGATRPILDNSNAENRANNRRVEIVIRPAPLTER